MTTTTQRPTRRLPRALRVLRSLRLRAECARDHNRDRDLALTPDAPAADRAADRADVSRATVACDLTALRAALSRSAPRLPYVVVDLSGLALPSVESTAPLRFPPTTSLEWWDSDDAAHRETLSSAVRLLDEFGPADWRDRVDPTTLDLYSTERCVLGQVYGDYDAGKRDLYVKTSRGSRARLYVSGMSAFYGGFPVELWRAELQRDAA